MRSYTENLSIVFFPHPSAKSKKAKGNGSQMYVTQAPTLAVIVKREKDCLGVKGEYGRMMRKMRNECEKRV